MAQRITRLTTDQKIAGSNPAGIEILKFSPSTVSASISMNGESSIFSLELDRIQKELRPRVGSNHQPFG